MVEEDEDYEGGKAEEEEGGGKRRARKLTVKKGDGGASVTLAKPLQGPAKAPRDAYGSQAVPAASIGALCARFVATCMTPAGAAATTVRLVRQGGGAALTGRARRYRYRCARLWNCNFSIARYGSAGRSSGPRPGAACPALHRCRRIQQTEAAVFAADALLREAAEAQHRHRQGTRSTRRARTSARGVGPQRRLLRAPACTPAVGKCSPLAPH